MARLIPRQVTIAIRLANGRRMIEEWLVMVCSYLVMVFIVLRVEL